MELSKAPYEASVKLNEQLNYLNAATLERIRNLELEGKAALAASVAMTTFAEASESRAFRFDENLGPVDSYDPYQDPAARDYGTNDFPDPPQDPYLDSPD